MQFENSTAKACFLMLDDPDTDFAHYVNSMNSLYNEDNTEFIGILQSALLKERSVMVSPFLNEQYKLFHNQSNFLLNRSFFDSGIEVTRYLLAEAPPPLRSLNYVLTWTCKLRQPASIELLIEAGADINHTNFSPLKDAAESDWLYSELDTFRLLLKHGAKFTHKWNPEHEEDFDYFVDNIFGLTTKGERPDSLMQLINAIGLYDHDGNYFDWQRYEPFLPDYAVDIFRSFELETVLTSAIQEITYNSEDKLQDNCSILSM